MIERGDEGPRGLAEVHGPELLLLPAAGAEAEGVVTLVELLPRLRNPTHIIQLFQ